MLRFIDLGHRASDDSHNSRFGTWQVIFQCEYQGRQADYARLTPPMEWDDELADLRAMTRAEVMEWTKRKALESALYGVNGANIDWF